MEKKVSVLHIITNLEHGGAQAVLYELLEGLNQERFTHVVIYFKPGVYVQKIEKLGIPTYGIQGLICRYDPFFIIRLVRLIKYLKPDCIHTILWAANFLGRLIASFYKIMHIESFHNSIYINGFMRLILDRFTASKHGKVIAVSHSVVHSLEKRAPWFVNKPVTVIKNGIALGNSMDYKGRITRADLGLSDNAIVIGSVGRFERVKNYRFLLTTFALLYDLHPKVRLVLVGQGSMEHFLRLRAYHLGIEDRVIFVIDKDAHDYYRLFDCFVQCSLSEGMSMALLEAMSYGVPPVVTCLEKKHDVIVHDETGLIVHSDQPQKLADALDRLIQSKALRRQLGCAAQEAMRSNYKVDEMVKAYRHVFKVMMK